MSVQIVVPELGESVLEATVKAWLKKEGERVSAGEALVELETDKVNVEVGAERAGVLGPIERQEGEDVRVGEVLGVIEDSAVDQPEQPTDAPEVEEQSQVGKGQASNGSSEEDRLQLVVEAETGLADAETRATPVAQRMAHELNIDLDQVKGTGPGGRVTRENIEGFLQKSGGGQPPAPESRLTPPVETLSTGSRGEERVKMSRRRRTIAQRLVEAQHTAAMLTTFNEVDMTALMDLRQRRNVTFKERYGVKLGITSFFVKAAIGALKAFPLLNAEIQGDEFVLKRYYDIGIAVGASEGLVVPVLRDADRLSFAQIETQINDFAARAESGSLSLEDLRGGTFSITNGGVFGSLLSTPILNPPQSGILGLHKIEPRPVAVNNEVVIRPMMYVALSYDHRIVDGREAVQFLARVKLLVEDPEVLLLEG
jgi:2-oxoglutarate dehydrogenase E2 component (dihydrolipoamide succinyltransferase)